MRKLKFVSVFVLLALLLGAGLGAMTTAQSPAKAQQSPPIPIQVDGQTVFLEPGKNVHPQTYTLLSQDPDFASRENVKWVFVDDMWVPLAREGLTEESVPGKGPIEELLPEKTPPGPLYNPECRITRNVPAYGQGWSPWGEDYLFNDSAHCGKMKNWGCAITSATMVFKYYGAGKNPGQVNTCCRNHGCRVDCSGTPEYDPCCLVWDCAANHCSDNEAGFVGYYGFYWSALCGLLSQDRPPIVKVGGHFVVVYKSLGFGDFTDPNGYYIVDPWDGSTYKKLSYYTTPSMIAEYYNK